MNDINKITVEQFLKIKTIQDTFKDDDVSILKQVAKLFDISKLNEAKLLINKLQIEFSKDTPFVRTFKFDGVEYGFIPSLEDITTDEYADISLYQKDFYQFHKLLSILYRPIIKKNKDLYNIEEYNGSIYSDTMKKVPCTILIGCLGFFLTLSEHCLKDSHIYSQKLMIKKMRKKRTLISMIKNFFKSSTVCTQ